MFDIFIPFGAFVIFMIAIVVLIAIGVIFYNIIYWLFFRDRDDERFD